MANERESSAEPWQYDPEPSSSGDDDMDFEVCDFGDCDGEVGQRDIGVYLGYDGIVEDCERE